MFRLNLLSTFLIAISCSYIVTIKFDTDHVITFKPPKVNQNHQAFGSSVAIIKSNDSLRFIIGAPTGDSSLIAIPKTGLVYSCVVNDNWKSSQCKEIPLQLKGNNGLVKIKKPFTSGMKIGLNLAVDQVEGLVTICGHLHSYSNQQPSGICFLVNGFSGDLVRILSPRVRKSLIPKSIKNISFKPLQAHEMFGFSSTFNRNSESIIIGIPGFDIFRGAFLSLTGHQQSTNLTLSTINDIDQDSYFGYSLTTGQFFTSNSELIAVGAPRGQQLKGQVFIMTIHSSDQVNQIMQELEGDQLGEYFGYSIQSIDLNADGYDDLLIGAPLFMPENNPRGDSGRVYVYFSDSQRLNRSPIIIDGDSRFGSRFGSALAIIGDLDSDGFKDFAVGAPQENEGSGSVYIYSGSQIKSSRKYYQKIDSSKSLGLSGFGSSIYSSIDVDEDKCPDILIGSYMSDAAILMRCRS